MRKGFGDERRGSRATLRLASCAAAVVVACTTVFGGSALAGDPVYQDINIRKFVEGPQPAGATFTMELSCFGGVVPDTVQVLTFDGAGSQDVRADPSQTCRLVETEDGGAASVVYGCDPDTVTECVDDQTVRVPFPVGFINGVSLSVRNTFEPETRPATGLDDSMGDVVSAAPGFTG